MIRRMRHHLADDRIQLRRDVWIDIPNRRRWRIQPAGQRFDRIAFEWERQLTRETPEQRSAEAEDVGPNVHRARVAGLFRRHVVDRAQDRTWDSHPMPEMAGKSEIEEFGLIFARQHDVRRLDVAVNQSILVRFAQRLAI